jgi:DNA-binding HxlR family transcriptional regulator
VRELLLGPQRFTDLRRALAAASSNILADRLRELEGHGVVQRRQLPPPAASSVYELTARGRELEPILLALGGWGIQFPPPATPRPLSAASVLLFLRESAGPDPGTPPTTYRLELDGQVWTVRSAAGRVHIEPGEPPAYDVGLRTDPTALNALLGDPTTLEAAIADRTVLATGDMAALHRLLNPSTPPADAGVHQRTHPGTAEPPNPT